LLAIGILLGGLWANEAWGTYWNWDPKETMALATLLAYGVYLHLNYSTNNGAVLLSWVSVGAFALLLVTYLGVNVLGLGLHSYGQF
jgi:ABC-type transport system involved in cytochrome c biogenesis permease subunit